MHEATIGPELVSAAQFNGSNGTETMLPPITESVKEPPQYEVDVMSSIARVMEARAQHMSRRGRQTSDEVLAGAKNVMEYLIQIGGRLTREAVPTGNVSGHLMDEFDMEPSKWTNVRNFLARHDLVVIEKSHHDAKQYSSIAINEKTLPNEAEAARRNKPSTAQPAPVPEARPEPETESKVDSDPYPEENDDEEMMLVKEMGADLAGAKGRSPNGHKKLPENWKSKRILIIIREHGMYFGEWVTADVFARLDETTKLALSVGMLHSPSYSCIDSPEARENFILNMVNKGVFEEEAKKTAEDLPKIINKAIKSGYLSANGAGPVLTEEGMRHITKIRPGSKRMGWTT